MGDDRLNNAVGTAVVPNKAIVYHPPSTIPSNSIAFGGTWTVNNEEATAGNNATLGLQFTADDVYLVMSGEGTVGVSYNGRHPHVDGAHLGHSEALHTSLRERAAKWDVDVDHVTRRGGVRLHVRIAPGQSTSSVRAGFSWV